MSIVIEALPDHSRFAAAVLRVFRTWIRWTQVLVVILILAVTGISAVIVQPVVSVIAAVICLPLALLVPWSFAWTIIRTNPKAVNTPVTYTLSASGLGASSVLGQSTIPWGSFTGAFELPGQIALRLDASFIPLPIGGLTADQASELRSWLVNAGVAVVR